MSPASWAAWREARSASQRIVTKKCRKQWGVTPFRPAALQYAAQFRRNSRAPHEAAVIAGENQTDPVLRQGGGQRGRQRHVPDSVYELGKRVHMGVVSAGIVQLLVHVDQARFPVHIRIGQSQGLPAPHARIQQEIEEGAVGRLVSKPNCFMKQTEIFYS